ncbi:MAG: TonB-dependent receptor plug domain-containing protein [Caulobacter sp.]|nr:TonB-dependent receptor plug domain-containing protein [Caulobacter sp.]
MSNKSARHALMAACAFAALSSAAMARAAEAPAPAPAPAAADPADAVEQVLVTSLSTTRSAVQLSGSEMQKILPGLSPLKAIQTLPGVTYVTADPWGNNEQNTSMFIHGFNGQQLGYTLDGVPLGDQSYGNYNGLSPQRAVISEVVGKVILSSGAGSLGIASTSNLGGAIETFTSDPRGEFGGQFNQTLGSYSATRTFLRVDTGTFGGNNSLYLAYAHQDARAWDFKGHQGGDQANLKYVRDGDAGKLTFYLSYSDKTEPNEDGTTRYVPSRPGKPYDSYQPYTRPFFYPDFHAALDYLDAAGNYPASEGENYRNYFSAAQRTDYLTYLKYDARLADNVTWSNQVYYHDDHGRGIVAGPIRVAGLPALFNFYFPGQDLKKVFGNSGYATRTTEYQIDRLGGVSTLNATIGDHQIEAGFWYEHNKSSAYRRWYPFDVNHPTTPYDVPTGWLITQYGSEIDNKVYQAYVQDQWRIRPDLILQGGFKSSIQDATGRVPVQPIVGSLANSTGLPEGNIKTKEWFLPQLGAVWTFHGDDELFVNVQKNLRHFQTYGGGGLSPFSLGSQAAFDDFKKTADPETAWTYELGLRGRRDLNLGPITGVDGQLSVYHVDFSNRLLGVAPSAAAISIVGGASIVRNVGNVKTDGVDMALTFRLGDHFSFYDALSYNKSTYQDDYQNGTTKVNGVDTPVIVRTAGKKIPGSPEWLNKFVASANYGGFEAQLIGDYVGERYATYTNDLKVDSFMLLSLQVSYSFQTPANWPIKDLKLSANITNLGQEKGDLNVNVSQAAGSYATFPIPPRQGFVTLSTRF